MSKLAKVWQFPMLAINLRKDKWVSHEWVTLMRTVRNSFLPQNVYMYMNGVQCSSEWLEPIWHHGWGLGVEGTGDVVDRLVEPEDKAILGRQTKENKREAQFMAMSIFQLHLASYICAVTSAPKWTISTSRFLIFESMHSFNCLRKFVYSVTCKRKTLKRYSSCMNLDRLN